MAEIPLVQGVREGGDSGAPYALENEILSETYDKLIDKLISEI